MPEKRFYRPELDALRFFAFLAVLMTHGEAFPGKLDIIRRSGGYGLTMFFLLSAYLITELLLREREQRGTISWGRFFVRRALRIWPLYYAFLLAALVIVLIPPHYMWTSRRSIVLMAFFVENWRPSNVSPAISSLWSISIEEQFYLIWPPIIKFGGPKLALAASILFIVSGGVWLWRFSAAGFLNWFATAVQFQSFAAGVIIALATRGKPQYAISRARRAILLIAGLFALLVAQIIAQAFPAPTFAGEFSANIIDVAGCAAIFLSVLGIENISPSLTYLGKISYGLYVFHGALLLFVEWIMPKCPPPWNIFLIDGLTLLLCVLVAHLSYQYFEKPFLMLKERFEVVKSRPA